MTFEQRAENASSQPNSEWVIRPARSADAEVVRDIAVRTWDVTYATTVDAPNRQRIIRQSYSTAGLRRSFERHGKNVWFWVAENRTTHQIAGFTEVVLWAGPQPTAELTRIYIMPEFQHQGLGQIFIETAIRTLKTLKSDLRPPRLVLSVEAHNAQAIKFYEARGFQFNKDFVLPFSNQILEMKEYELAL